LDTEAIFSVKTGGIYQEDSMFGGVASDISAMIMEECLNFWMLSKTRSKFRRRLFLLRNRDQYLPKVVLKGIIRPNSLLTATFKLNFGSH
jgi:2-oxoisovalerate dehydrogenase E1 component